MSSSKRVSSFVTDDNATRDEGHYRTEYVVQIMFGNREIQYIIPRRSDTAAPAAQPSVFALFRKKPEFRHSSYQFGCKLRANETGLMARLVFIHLHTPPLPSLTLAV